MAGFLLQRDIALRRNKVTQLANLLIDHLLCCRIFSQTNIHYLFYLFIYLQELRKNTKFDELYDKCIKRSETLNIERPSLPRMRKCLVRCEKAAADPVVFLSYRGIMQEKIILKFLIVLFHALILDLTDPVCNSQHKSNSFFLPSMINLLRKSYEVTVKNMINWNSKN